MSADVVINIFVWTVMQKITSNRLKVEQTMRATSPLPSPGLSAPSTQTPWRPPGGGWTSWSQGRSTSRATSTISFVWQGGVERGCYTLGIMCSVTLRLAIFMFSVCGRGVVNSWSVYSIFPLLKMHPSLRMDTHCQAASYVWLGLVVAKWWMWAYR